MTASPDLPGSADEPVGAALARWRKQKQISGQVLADRAGVSQATISRIENGRSAADPKVVRRIARGLEVPADEVERLAALAAERSSNEFIEWHSTKPGLPERQNQLRGLEASVREVRTFQPAVFVGLLQTSEYARAILTGLRAALDDDQIADSALVVSEAVTARMQRSQVLDDPTRQFRFVMAEAVFRNELCRPAEMIVQIERLREVADKPNVDIRIIPQGAALPIAPFHGFELMGDRHVFVDLFNASVVSDGRSTVRHYQRVFDALEAAATTEIGPILDAYRNHYIRRLPEAAA